MTSSLHRGEVNYVWRYITARSHGYNDVSNVSNRKRFDLLSMFNSLFRLKQQQKEQQTLLYWNSVKGNPAHTSEFIPKIVRNHYDDVIMSLMASQITSLIYVNTLYVLYKRKGGDKGIGGRIPEIYWTTTGEPHLLTQSGLYIYIYTYIYIYIYICVCVCFCTIYIYINMSCWDFLIMCLIEW